MTKEMINIIKGLSKEKRLVLSSHDMDFIYEVCDYIYILSKGEILGEGKPEEIFLKTDLIQKALLDKPWLVKIHETLGYPLLKSKQDFIK